MADRKSLAEQVVSQKLGIRQFSQEVLKLVKRKTINEAILAAIQADGKLSDQAKFVLSSVDDLYVSYPVNSTRCLVPMFVQTLFSLLLMFQRLYKH